MPFLIFQAWPYSWDRWRHSWRRRCARKSAKQPKNQFWCHYQATIQNLKISYGFAVVTHVPPKTLSNIGVSIDGEAWKVTHGGKSLKIGHKILFFIASDHGTEFLPRCFELCAMPAPVPPNKLDTRRRRHFFHPILITF